MLLGLQFLMAFFQFADFVLVLLLQPFQLVVPLLEFVVLLLEGHQGFVLLLALWEHQGLLR